MDPVLYVMKLGHDRKGDDSDEAGARGYANQGLASGFSNRVDMPFP